MFLHIAKHFETVAVRLRLYIQFIYVQYCTTWIKLHLNLHNGSNYCAYHVLVQPNFRRYYFYFLPYQAQILLDHFNVLVEL